MTKLVEVRCENADAFAGVPTFFSPGVSSSRSAAPLGSPSSVTNSTVNGLVGATKISFARNPDNTADPTSPTGLRNQRADIFGMYFEDYVNATAHPYLTWKFNTFPNESAVVPKSQYSFRMYFKYATGLLTGSFPHVVTFRDSTAAGGTDRFAMYLGDYAYTGTGSIWDFNAYSGYQPYMTSGGSANTLTPRSVAAADSLSTNTTWRLEVVVNSAATPKVTAKLYNWNSTTPFKTLTCSPASVAADSFVIGAWRAGSYQPQLWVNNIELHDDLTLGGTLNSHYSPPKMTWTEWKNGAESPTTPGVPGRITDAGEKVLSGVAVSDTTTLNLNDFKREIAYSTSNYLKFSDPDNPSVGRTDPYPVNDTFQGLRYDDPQNNGSHGYRSLDLYVPNGTPPTGGWPVVMWAHSGSFSGGDKISIPRELVKNLLYSGYAVANVNYMLATALIGATVGPVTITKPAWPNQGSGAFPSFIICYKLAAKYLQNNASMWNLNASKFCAAGYSAGGFAALAAAESYGLTNHGGKNLTVTNTDFPQSLDASGNYWATTDPVFKCAYGFAPPIDMQLAYNYDPSHPTWGLGNQGIGGLRLTSAAFMGVRYDTNMAAPSILANTSVTSMIAAQSPSQRVPVGYLQGLSDFLVHWEHEAALSAQCAASGVTYTRQRNTAFHDLVCEQFDIDHLTKFLNACGM